MMQEAVLEMLHKAIEEIESGRARGCFLACFGPEDDDVFSVSACEPEIRNLVIDQARAILADIESIHHGKMS